MIFSQTHKLTLWLRLHSVPLSYLHLLVVLLLVLHLCGINFLDHYEDPLSSCDFCQSFCMPIPITIGGTFGFDGDFIVIGTINGNVTAGSSSFSLGMTILHVSFLLRASMCGSDIVALLSSPHAPASLPLLLFYANDPCHQIS